MSARIAIDEEERLRLWVGAGGRCAMCNTYLLEHEFTAMNIHTGEMAHIVGATQSSRSPRGEADLPIEQRNLAANLVLLCPSDHTLIDKRLALNDWMVTDLRDLKRRHEDRMRYMTGLGEDAETVVLRIVGTVRGAAVELSSETVRQAVRAQQRYPRYELGVRSDSDIELDLRGVPAEGEPLYWDTVEAKIGEVIGTQLAAGVERGRVRHLSVFGIARIAVLVMVGHALDDKIPTNLYQLTRDDLGWTWAEGEQPIAFETALIAGETSSENVTLLCSVSGSVSVGDLEPAIVDHAAVYEIRPVNETPRPDLLRVRESLAAFSAIYRAFLAQLERDHPNTTNIDLVPAVPITAAIELGRRRMRDVHPRLRVWERIEDRYVMVREVGP